MAKWNDYTQEQYQFQISFKHPVDLKFKFYIDYDDQFAVLGQETTKLFIIQVKSPFEGEHFNLIRNFENIARERLAELDIESSPFTNHINVIKQVLSEVFEVQELKSTSSPKKRNSMGIKTH